MCPTKYSQSRVFLVMLFSKSDIRKESKSRTRHSEKDGYDLDFVNHLKQVMFFGAVSEVCLIKYK